MTDIYVERDNRVPPYCLDGPSFELVKERIKALANMIGQEIGDDEITIAKLPLSDAVTLKHTIDGGTDETWIETPLVTPYSIEYGHKPTGSVSHDWGDVVFKYLIKRAWREERSRIIKQTGHTAEHHNGTILTRWMAECTYSGKKQIHIQIEQGRLGSSAETFIKSNGSTISILSECIYIDKELPQTTVEALPSKTIGQVISLPHCGHEKIQNILEKTQIKEAEQQEDLLRIDLWSYATHPLMDEPVKSLWRRYQDIQIGRLTAFRLKDKAISYEYEEMAQNVLEAFARTEREWQQDKEKKLCLKAA